MTLAELEAHQIKRVLAAVDGHIGQAAKRLGILRSSLYDKVKRLGLKVTEAGVRPSLVRVVDDL
jgi:DNA-binding NtrC family response regulator